jgi:TRAP-type C4-dicarboxylate transport system permease small subunit
LSIYVKNIRLILSKHLELTLDLKVRFIEYSKDKKIITTPLQNIDHQIGGAVIGALVQILRGISFLNSFLLGIGRTIGWISLALMVFVILLQVFFRYVLDSALPWPDEAARFLMLWMTGLIAPLAYRGGGFVAIDMLGRALPKHFAKVLSLVLLLFSTLILVKAVEQGWSHTMGFGGSFNSASLKFPLEWIDMPSVKLKLQYMYGSLLVCVVLMTSINIEMLIRTIIEIFRPDLAPAQGQSDPATGIV